MMHVGSDVVGGTCCFQSAVEWTNRCPDLSVQRAEDDIAHPEGIASGGFEGLTPEGGTKTSKGGITSEGGI